MKEEEGGGAGGRGGGLKERGAGGRRLYGGFTVISYRVLKFSSDCSGDYRIPQN